MCSYPPLGTSLVMIVVSTLHPPCQANCSVRTEYFSKPNLLQLRMVEALAIQLSFGAQPFFYPRDQISFYSSHPDWTYIALNNSVEHVLPLKTALFPMCQSPLVHIFGLSTTSIQTGKISFVVYTSVFVSYVALREHGLRPMMISGITLPKEISWSTQELLALYPASLVFTHHLPSHSSK